MASLVIQLLDDNLQHQDWQTYRIRVMDTVKRYTVTNLVYGEDWFSGNRSAVYFISDIPPENLPAIKTTLYDLARFFNQSNLTIVEGITENVA